MQACLIAFTTEYPVRLTYTLFYSPNLSLDGYVDFTLSEMNASRFELSAATDLSLLGNTTVYKYAPPAPALSQCSCLSAKLFCINHVKAQ